MQLASIEDFQIYFGHILSFIHTFVPHLNRLKVDADHISELGFFSPEILGAKVGMDNAPMRLIYGHLW